MSVLYDRRARHLIVSEPVCLDLANDIDALAQEGMYVLANAHFRALGSGDSTLVDLLVRAGERFQQIRERAHEGAGLVAISAHIDPYLALAAAKAA